MIDMDAAVAFNGYLKPTDRIKWAARPLAEVTFALGGRERMIYAGVLAGFTVIWMAVIIYFNGPPMLKIAGLAVLGAAAVVGPAYPWLRAYRLRHTVYALTHNQVMIIENRQVTTVPLSDVGRVEVEEGPDGRGSVIFRDHRMQASAEEMVFPLLWRRPTLFNIPNAKAVRDLIVAGSREAPAPGIAPAVSPS
ncbi:hypothetical protein [Alsobacter sp. R-9]